MDAIATLSIVLIVVIVISNYSRSNYWQFLKIILSVVLCGLNVYIHDLLFASLWGILAIIHLLGFLPWIVNKLKG